MPRPDDPGPGTGEGGCRSGVAALVRQPGPPSADPAGSDAAEWSMASSSSTSYDGEVALASASIRAPTAAASASCVLASPAIAARSTCSLSADFRITSAVAASAGRSRCSSRMARTPGSSSAVWCQARYDGGAQVHGLGHLLALDPAGEAGVPLQLEGGEEVEVVGERGRDAIDVAGQHAVAALVGRGDDVAEHVSTTVEGRPGHGLVLSLGRSGGTGTHIPGVRTQSTGSY